MSRIILLTSAIVTGFVVADDAEAFGGRMGMMAPPAFAQLDADGDGKVTAAELEAYPAARAAERFSQADADGNGALSPEELTAAIDRMRVEAMMSRLDTDGDGAVSQAEMEAMMGQMRETVKPGERMLERADTDKDGTISAAEYDAFAESRMKQRGRGFGKWGPRPGDGSFWRN
ncbi:MAG: EF-hand domain-containing protein [Tropicimonas sp.]|uniref:EF-hand domain-containing protein n=1 Tax=Tropicimonas sp. TaxID=2067044 RepID=UPI003A880B91